MQTPRLQDGKFPEPTRLHLERLRGQLDYEFGTFLSTYRELGENILPRRPRFAVTDVNRGERRNLKIVDGTPTMAARTLRSGMMGGITSPARPWFRLTTPDPDLSDIGSVHDWLELVGHRLLTIFLKSNVYKALPTVYGDIGNFATAAMALEEDMEQVIRAYVFPVGSYRIANDSKGRVAVFQRTFQMTVRQLVGKFGKQAPNGDIDWSNFSSFVKNQWDIGQRETWVQVSHTVEPNPSFKPGHPFSQFKKFREIYYEIGMAGASASDGYGMGGTGDGWDEKFLWVKGYDYFPILCPRWETNAEDAYGTSCPGMDAIGDVKQLYLMQKRKAQAIEKMVNPPLVGPAALRTLKSSILPGDTTYLDEREGMKGLRPIHEVNPRVAELIQDITDIRERINEAFYKDLFLMMLDTDRRQITAREIDERKEEQLLALGPVLEQLDQDLLNPMIEITFQIAVTQGIIPPPPQELMNQPLRVEYLSIMAQAQKLVGLQGLQTFMGMVNNMGQLFPEIVDKVDIDKYVEVAGDATTVPPGVVRTEDAVQQIRQQKQQAAAAQQQAEQMSQATQAAKNLSQADMSGDNALTRLSQATQGGQVGA